MGIPPRWVENSSSPWTPPACHLRCLDFCPSPAHDATPDPLVGWGEEKTCWGGGYPLPRSLPSRRLQHYDLATLALAKAVVPRLLLPAPSSAKNTGTADFRGLGPQASHQRSHPIKLTKQKNTRNAWQSLAYSPLGAP